MILCSHPVPIERTQIMPKIIIIPSPWKSEIVSIFNKEAMNEVKRITVRVLQQFHFECMCVGMQANERGIGTLN